jgi:transposase
MALEMYLEGFGFRSIGRILKISYGTVYSWIKQWNASISFPRRDRTAETVELEALLAYVESKKAADGHELLLIDLEKEISFLSTDSTPRQKNKSMNQK